MDEILKNYTQRIEAELQTCLGENRTPASLYEPIRYFLSIGGKRLRPLLSLLGAQAVGKDPLLALKPAIGIELFHNFSLVHDDIMDEAPLRRGHITLHEKHNLNTAILAGDALLIEAYKFIANVPPQVLLQVLETFNKTALQVCEGQQLDLDFEERDNVTLKSYTKMIQYKTSVLLGCAIKIGALAAGAKQEQAEMLYDFALNMGTSFQIMDDYLDAFGNPEKTGKQVGGDILANKKTLILIHAFRNASPGQLRDLRKWMAAPASPAKVAVVKGLFVETKSVDFALEEAERFYKLALMKLEAARNAGLKTKTLEAFAKWLYKRDS